MAAQAGLGLSRVIILVGAGYTGTVLLQKGKLSDLLAELQGLLKGNGKGGDSETDSDPVTAQIQHLAMEVRRLASARPITVFHGDSRQNGLASLVVPTAVVGALGYGYMKWKGITFSDLMYVTKRNMAAAVTNLTKHLADVSDAVAATKRHLTQRIENLDTRMDEQLDLSKLINHNILEVQGDISNLTISLDDLEKSVLTLSDTMGTLDKKQNLANMAIVHLVRLAHGVETKLPERIQEEMKTLGKLEASTNLKDVVKALEMDTNSRRSITDVISEDGNDKPRAFFRRPSLKS